MSENSATARRIMGAAMSTILACPHCGFANQPGAKFCANCGRPVASRCPECVADVASGARFCSNCGILLAGRARTETGVSPEVPAEARKVVTVLFADLA
ncbi:MAG TPA: zinc ribbon domain-containing protein, partial [Anaerolineales bacterium]